MPEVIERTIYTLAELEGKARDAALETLSGWAVDYDWWEDVIDCFVETTEDEDVITIARKTASTVGGRTITEPQVHFSGFWSQGDGASFAGTVDVAAYLKLTKQAGKKRSLYNWAVEQGASFRIVTSGRYSHEYTMTVDCDYNDLNYLPEGKALDQVEGLEDEILEWARDKARKLYKELEEEYEYRTHEDQLIENAEANDYRFYEDGEVV